MNQPNGHKSSTGELCARVAMAFRTVLGAALIGSIGWLACANAWVRQFTHGAYDARLFAVVWASTVLGAWWALRFRTACFRSVLCWVTAGAVMGDILNGVVAMHGWQRLKYLFDRPFSSFPVTAIVVGGLVGIVVGCLRGEIRIPTGVGVTNPPTDQDHRRNQSFVLGLGKRETIVAFGGGGLLVAFGWMTGSDLLKQSSLVFLVPIGLFGLAGIIDRLVGVVLSWFGLRKGTSPFSTSRPPKSGRTARP